MLTSSAYCGNSRIESNRGSTARYDSFTVISLLLPFAGSLPVMLVLLVLAGLASGTFYPLTLSFVLRNLPPRYVLVGIAMYAMDIIFTTNFATSLEAWYIDRLSWHWISTRQRTR